MIFRFAEASDIERVTEIEQASMSCPWKKADFEEALNSDHTIFAIAEGEDSVKGFCLLYLTPPEAELPDIVVDSASRGQGVGRSLLSFTLDAARKHGIETVFLEVRQSNTRAKTLYSYMGFEEIGIRKNFYREPVEHAICMSLQLERI